MLAENQTCLLRLLATEHQRFRSMPPPETPERLSWPHPDLEALVGMSAVDVRRSLGEPDFHRTADDGSSKWTYSFCCVPPHYRGGGLDLDLDLGAGDECIGARWKLSR